VEGGRTVVAKEHGELKSENTVEEEGKDGKWPG